MREPHPALFDHRGLCMESHHFVAHRLDGGDCGKPLGLEFLEELRAGGPIFDEDDGGAPLSRECHHGPFELRVVDLLPPDFAEDTAGD